MERLQEFSKECKRAFKKAEINFINNTIQDGLENNNTKPFWRYIKSKRQDSVGIAPLKRLGNLVTDSKGKAEILVDQFKSVFTQDTSSTLPHMDKKYTHNLPPLKNYS